MPGKSDTFEFRLSDDDRRLLNAGAKRLNVSASELVRQASLTYARQIIA